jgi:superfamily II DNA helicase RecQ
MCLPPLYNFIEGRNDSIVLVISPLIALMQDQVERCAVMGLHAVHAGDCSLEIRQKIMSGNTSWCL